MRRRRKIGRRTALGVVLACAAVLAVDVVRNWRHVAVGTAGLVWLSLNVSERTDVV